MNRSQMCLIVMALSFPVSYLKTAVGQALSGEYLIPPLMEKQFVNFGTEEIDALVNFYASQQ